MGSILQPHILLKYFVQSGKKQSVTGLRAVKPGSGGRGHVTTLQISEHISARQGGGCKNTQLLPGDILPLPSRVRIAEGLKNGWTVPEPSDRYSSDPHKSCGDSLAQSGTQVGISHFRVCFVVCQVITPCALGRWQQCF